ncbi:hypothetical protein [Nitrosococcus watsonii]|uniref:Uncharacterized protein n=1 Tax=Nitrosococcus watsoni (strain C-113) TaxID=105559 RepID=D8K5K8_NITWC|nr:hypothetical protein [Nitrosococcus watsonii]ADJ28185.1 hypothetical protein Nwat_1256 [Nitrosococcus watsonii C-113]
MSINFSSLLQKSFPSKQPRSAAVKPSEAVAHLGEDFAKIKADIAEHLQEEQRRVVLFNGLDALQAIWSNMPEVISVEARVVTKTRPGQDEFDQARWRQIGLIRIGQGLVVLAVLALAVLEPSAITVVIAVLVLVLALAEVAVTDLDPYRRFRPAFFLSLMGRPAGLVHRMIFGA